MSVNLTVKDIENCCNQLDTILDDFSIPEDAVARRLIRHYRDDVEDRGIPPRDVAAFILCHSYPLYGILVIELPSECGDMVTTFVREYFAGKGIGYKGMKKIGSDVRDDHDEEEDDDDDDDDESFEPVLKRARSMIETQFDMIEGVVEGLEKVTEKLKRKHDEAAMKFREAERCLKECFEIAEHFDEDELKRW